MAEKRSIEFVIKLLKSGAGVEQATAELEKLREEQRKNNQESEKSTELFGKNKEKLERLRSSIGLVTGAFAGGFAIGTGIAKKAGVDFTETLRTLGDMTEVIARKINRFVVGALQGLTEGFRRFTKFIGSDKASAWLENLGDGLSGMADSTEQLADKQKKLAAETKAAAEALEKQKAAAADLVVARENDIKQYGKTEERVRALYAAKIALAKLERKTAQQIRTIILERKDELKSLIQTTVKFGKSFADAMSDAAKLQKKTKQDEIQAAGEANAAMLAAFEEYATELGETEQSLNQLRLNRLKVGDENYLAKLKKFKQKELELWAEANQGKIGFDEEYQERRLAMLRELGETESNITITGINAGLSAASQAFPENKEIKIAQAIMNTYESATGAYNAMASIPYVGPALGAAAAAMAIVAGLKNVQAIQDQKPPKEKQITAPSFDDPANDAIARAIGASAARAGALSASDMANKFNEGWNSRNESGAHRFDGRNTRATFPNAPQSGGGGATIIINQSPFGAQKDLVRAARRELAVWDKSVESRVRGTRSKRIR